MGANIRIYITCLDHRYYRKTYFSSQRTSISLGPWKGTRRRRVPCSFLASQTPLVEGTAVNQRWNRILRIDLTMSQLRCPRRFRLSSKTRFCIVRTSSRGIFYPINCTESNTTPRLLLPSNCINYIFTLSHPSLLRRVFASW